MNTEKYSLLMELLDDAMLRKLAKAVGNEPIVFSVMWHCRQHQIIYDGFKSNLPLDEIAKQCHLHKRTVYRHLRKYFKRDW